MRDRHTLQGNRAGKISDRNDIGAPLYSWEGGVIIIAYFSVAHFSVAKEFHILDLDTAISPVIK